MWIGAATTTEPYQVEVDDSTGQEIAQSGQLVVTKSWAWQPFPLREVARPVRGKTYKIVVRRTNGGGISFAYDPNNPYRFGRAVANGSMPPMDSLDDLALRVFGLHDTIDRTYWTMDPGQPVCWWDTAHEWKLRDTWIERMHSSGVGPMRFEISWPEIQPDTLDLDSFNFVNLDTNLALLKDDSCGAFVLLDLTALVMFSGECPVSVSGIRTPPPPAGLLSGPD